MHVCVYIYVFHHFEKENDSKSTTRGRQAKSAIPNVQKKKNVHQPRERYEERKCRVIVFLVGQKIKKKKVPLIIAVDMTKWICW